MTLVEWLKQNKVSPENFGVERVKCHRSTIRKFLLPESSSAHRKPNDRMKLRIWEATGREVPPATWIILPTDPAPDHAGADANDDADNGAGGDAGAVSVLPCAPVPASILKRRSAASRKGARIRKKAQLQRGAVAAE